MKNIKLYRLSAWVLALLVCVSPLLAAPDVPDPTADFYVGDFADVLSDDVEQYIIEKNQSLEASTGAQIVVVTVDFLDGYDIDDYAVTLFNEWCIGSAESNNGYLILLAIADENYYSVPGQGIENVFTGGVVDDLQWNYLEEGFAAEDYDAGVRSYFDAVLDVFEEQYGPISAVAPSTGTVQPEAPVPDNVYQPPQHRFGLYDVFVGIVVVIILFAVILVFAGRRTIYVAGMPYRRRWGFWGPMIPYRPRPPRPRPPRRRPPPPPPRSSGGFGGFGGPRGGGSTRGGGAGRRPGGFGGFGGSSFGGSRGGGSFRGGGGVSRGGGAGRRGR